jgi:hypothetical protein
VILRLTRVDGSSISSLREERRRGITLGIVPAFYGRLVDEAEAYVIEEERLEGGPVELLGHTLVLERPHDGHSHVTAIELYLRPSYQHRYEDALDLLREALHPTAYLTRTDECLYNATLLSRGRQVEPTALVMRWRGGARDAGASGKDAAMELGDLAQHLEGVRSLLDGEKDGEILGQLEKLAVAGRGWAVIKEGAPVGVIARQDAGDRLHELVDFALGKAAESELSRALELVAKAVTAEGLEPAAVIDATEAARHRIFRGAGFYTAASYMVYYDPEAGRPSVARITTQELRALLDRGERVRLVDVLGEEHWNDAHLPGSEWIDFKGLAKEALRRFQLEEPIIVYCNGFT